jgi:hypothetical protein
MSVQHLQPGLLTALIAMCGSALMVYAGLAKRRLDLRPRRVIRKRRRRP